jgi:hypothetical protein
MYVALLAFIFGLLIRTKSHNQEHAQNDSNSTTNKQSNNSNIVPVRVQISFSEEDQNERRAYQEKHYALQKSLKRASWLTFWAVFIYAGITLAMWSATKKAADAAKESADVTRDSFNMAKRHTEDSDEAILQPVTLSLEPDQNVATMLLMNTGQVTAHKITAHLEVWRTSLPSNHRQKLLREIDISQEELRKNDNIRIQVALPDFGKSERDYMVALKEGITFISAIGYENGFDTRRNPKGCMTQLMKTPNPGDNPQTPTGTIIPCENVPAWLVNERVVRQRFLDQQKPK